MNTNKLNQTFTQRGFFLWTIIGPTNSGKTYEMVRIIKNDKYGILKNFDVQNVYIFSKHALRDKSMKPLIEKLEEEKDLNDEPVF